VSCEVSKMFSIYGNLNTMATGKPGLWEETLLSHLRKRKPPGDMDAIEREASEILQTPAYAFRGVQVTIQNVLHRNFLTLHSLELGKKETIGPDGQGEGDVSAYNFTGYLKTARWTMNARMGSTATSARLEYENGPFVGSCQGNFSDDPNKGHIEFDLNLKVLDATLQFKTADFGAFGFAYSQNATDNVTAAVEIFGVPDDSDRCRLKTCLKVALPQDNTLLLSGVVSSNLGPDQAQFTWYRKVTKNYTLLSSAEFSYVDKQRKAEKDWNSILRLGYNFSIRDAMMPMPAAKGLIDSSGNIALSFEEPLNDLMSATFSAKVNPLTDDYDFGVGLGVSM